MATIAEEEKKKRGSYGDAAAAAQSPSVVRVDAPRLGMSPDPLANQTAMYVAGAQAANPQPPAAPRPAPIATPAALDPGAMVGNPTDFTNRVQPPATQPAAPAVSQPVGGAAFGVPPSMGRRPASPVVAPAPAAPVPLEQRLGWRTDAVMNGAAEDASAAFNKGNYGETAGALVRGAATAIPTAVVDFGEGLAGGIVPAAQGFIRGLTGGQAPAPTAPAAPAARPAVPTGPAQGNPNARTDVQRASAAAPAPTQTTAPDGSPLVTDAGNGIRRIEAQGKSPLFTNVGDADNSALMGRSGVVSSQNQNAAQNLSNRYAGEARGAMAMEQYNQEVATAQAINARPIAKDTGGFGILSKEYQDRRNASFAPSSLVGDAAKSGAIVAQGKALDDQALENVKSDRDEARVSARERGATDRAVLQESGTNARFGMTNKLAQQKADAEQTKLGFETKAAAQIQTLQQQIIAEKDPAKLAVLQDKMQTMTGKYQRPEPANKFTVVPGGQVTDEKTGMPRTVPSYAIENNTGKVVTMPGNGQSAPAAPNAGHISALRASPEMAAQFDAKFGTGAAARALAAK